MDQHIIHRSHGAKKNTRGPKESTYNKSMEHRTPIHSVNAGLLCTGIPRKNRSRTIILALTNRIPPLPGTCGTLLCLCDVQGAR